MYNKTFLVLMILVLTCFGCVSNSAAYENNSSEPANQNSPFQQEQNSQGSSPPSISGLHFSGNSSSTWSINKDPGMALMHIRDANCPGFVLSGKGTNIPGSEQGLFQGYPVLTHYEKWEGNYILDAPTIWKDYYNAPPQTEALKIEVDPSSNCSWDLTISPMSSAKSISPGETISGYYDDVLKVKNGLSGIYLNLNSSDNQMLQHFRGIYAILSDGSDVCLDCQQGGEDYQIDSLPSGTEYLYFYSLGYWELQGK